MDRLAGQTALVTGAGNGIGRACALAFARAGAAVVVTDVLETAVAETASLVTDAGGRAVALAGDAASARHNERAMATAVEQFGRLDILLTAAGVSHADYRSGDIDAERRRLDADTAADRARRFAETSLAEWQHVIDVNLTGTFLAVQAAARVMLDRNEGGSIITVSSIAAQHPDAGRLAYGVSKAGVVLLTKHAASCLGPHGIRVNSLAPGLVDTNMLAVVDEVPGMRQSMLAAVPLRRFGAADEIANAAVFLASNESSYITGEVLHPSGGYFVG
jgi:NAD(P)-dependent dehydrogenase (short-subunit alcohol dehydrogenase family)